MSRVGHTARERVLDDEAVQMLVEETGRPIDAVRKAYEHELELLQRDARVQDYLALFAARRAREALLRGEG